MEGIIVCRQLMLLRVAQLSSIVFGPLSIPKVEAVTDRMPEAAVNLHGTRCVQKVVEVSEMRRLSKRS